jgi:hypothetical protein
MGRRSSVVLLAALAAATSLLTPACRKGAPSDSRDASSNADASLDGASSLSDDAGVAPAVVATAAPLPSSTELAAFQPPPNPFTGTYRCFGGMKLEQAGRIVTSTIHKGTTDTVLACTAGRDTCTGTVREIQTIKGKPPKVMHVKAVTLTRLTSGDIVYLAGAETKAPSKADQTMCLRR